MHQIIHSFTYPLSIHSSTPSFIHPHLSIHSYFPPFHPSFAPPFLYFLPNFIHYIRSLIRSYILTFIHSFIDSSIHHTFIHSFIHPIVRSFIHAPVHSIPCTYSFHSFNHRACSRRRPRASPALWHAAQPVSRDCPCLLLAARGGPPHQDPRSPHCRSMQGAWSCRSASRRLRLGNLPSTPHLL